MDAVLIVLGKKMSRQLAKLYLGTYDKFIHVILEFLALFFFFLTELHSAIINSVNKW